MYGPPTQEAIVGLIRHLELMLDAVPTEAEAQEILRAQEEADQRPQFENALTEQVAEIKTKSAELRLALVNYLNVSRLISEGALAGSYVITDYQHAALKAFLENK